MKRYSSSILTIDFAFSRFLCSQKSNIDGSMS
jgi:hypothetical protein